MWLKTAKVTMSLSTVLVTMDVEEGGVAGSIEVVTTAAIEAMQVSILRDIIVITTVVAAASVDNMTQVTLTTTVTRTAPETTVTAMGRHLGEEHVEVVVGEV
jgi:hypothetical protein